MIYFFNLKMKSKLSVVLEWFDSSDLDINAICPCKTHIFFAQTDCYKCLGYLDCDANSNIKENSNNPIERIYWDSPIDGEYHIFVSCFENRNFNPITQSYNNIPYQVTINYNGRNKIYNGQINYREKQTILHDNILDIFDDIELYSYMC